MAKRNRKRQKISIPKKPSANSLAVQQRAAEIADVLSESGIDYKTLSVTGKPVGNFLSAVKAKKRILDAFAAGANQRLAASYAGISEKTLSEWLMRGRKELLRLGELAEDGVPVSWESVETRELPYVDLVLAVERARGEAGMRWLAVLNKAAQESPKWAAYSLENQFGWKSQNIEQHTTGSTSVVLTAEQLRAARDSVGQWETERFGDDTDGDE